MCAGVGGEELHKERAPVHPSAAAQQPAADCALPGPRARRDSEHGADAAPLAGPLLPLPWRLHPHRLAPGQLHKVGSNFYYFCVYDFYLLLLFHCFWRTYICLGVV